MMITYGHHVSGDDDEYVKLAEEVVQTSEPDPGRSIVDLLPLRECSLSYRVRVLRIPSTIRPRLDTRRWLQT